MFELEDVRGKKANIKVVGVGGGGGNVVNNMIASNISAVDLIAINTDAQVLETSLATQKVQIGVSVTRGLGAGSKPEIGRQSAIEDRLQIAEALEGADMVFVTAGMGGGTGTGASPVVAGIARELGALVVGVVTKPFFYEGRQRMLNAEEGIKELAKNVDTLIVIPNDRIRLVVEMGTPLLESFSIANNVLKYAVQGIADLIVVTGLINVDFADVKTIMDKGGRSVMGMGIGKGEGRAREASKKAISNPLLESSSIEGAKRILINVTGGLDLTLGDAEEAASIIYDSADKEANIIFGAVIDPDIRDEIRVTIIAAGFDSEGEKKKPELEARKWTVPNINLKGSDRVLAKTLTDFPIEMPVDSMPFEEPLDVPTFLRKTHRQMEL
ncbi:MAG: cell division protein FtsZ [Nitrospirae bacterium]|nr:cell division protein FtsZ [Nitrospirota bacterium]